MDHAPSAVELLGFAEEDVFVAGLVEFAELLYALEPNDLHCRCAVGEEPDEACLGSLADYGEADEASAELDEGHLSGEVADAVDVAPVEVMGGEMAQEVVDRAEV